jgi:heat shock protein HslJ
MSSHRRSVARLTGPIIALTFVAAGLLAACGDDEPDAGSTPTVEDLTGRTFLSTEVTGQTLIDDTRVSLAFSADSLAMVAGCNTHMGGYSIEDGELVVPALASTLMMCDDEAMQQDAWIAELLGGSPQISLDGSTLSLVSPDVTLTMIDRSAIDASSELIGGTWAIDSLESADSSTAAPEGAHMAADDGRLYVATGCNRGSASLTVEDGNAIVVGPMALTMMACEQELMDWEQSLLAFLGQPLTYTLTGEDLVLDNGSEQLLLHFVP